jgi:CMP-N-acetylneuraminic acid synthetase
MSPRPEGQPLVTGLVFMKLESERVHRKNLRDVGGRPLFEWIFETLNASSRVKDVILNTDSELIAEEVSKRFPVRVHMRPDHLLTIQSNEANQIVGWDLEQVEDEYFIQTHSTNPLLSLETLDRAIDCYFAEAVPEGHDTLFSVTPHQKRFFTEDGQPVNHDPTRLQKTQELPPLLEENSCIYLFSRKAFMGAGRNRIGRNPYLFRMSAEEAMDIDTEDDLRLADFVLRATRGKA